jgi:hypothetical protein
MRHADAIRVVAREWHPVLELQEFEHETTALRGGAAAARRLCTTSPKSR